MPARLRRRAPRTQGRAARLAGPSALPRLARPPCPGWQEVPPDTLPLDPVEPRPTPRERQQVIEYLLRQDASRPGPLAAWLVGRESAYYDGPGRSWDCAAFSYAAARDCVCWQLNRNERELLGLVEGFGDAKRQQPQ